MKRFTGLPSKQWILPVPQNNKITPKKPLTLDFPSAELTKRDKNNWSYIVDHGGPIYEGRALNANYSDVEAACIICTALGEAGYKYGEDFAFETCGLDKVSIVFWDEGAATYAAMRLKKLPKEGLQI